MQPIFLIMGTPACGKSTVAKALASCFALGLHIPVDDLRHMVTSGIADMDFSSEEAAHATGVQIRLAREAASHMARLYQGAGFAVAIDDFWFEDVPDTFMQLGFHGVPETHYQLGSGVHKIVLLPSVEVTLARLRGRQSGSGGLADVISFLNPMIQAHPKTGWHVVDSSDLSVEQTVDRILEVTSAFLPSSAAS